MNFEHALPFENLQILSTIDKISVSDMYVLQDVYRLYLRSLITGMLLVFVDKLQIHRLLK